MIETNTSIDYLLLALFSFSILAVSLLLTIYITPRRIAPNISNFPCNLLEAIWTISQRHVLIFLSSSFTKVFKDTSHAIACNTLSALLSPPSIHPSIPPFSTCRRRADTKPHTFCLVCCKISIRLNFYLLPF